MYDELTSKEIIDTVWMTIEHYKSKSGKGALPHDIAHECSNNLLKRAMIAKSEDNLSVVVIFLKPLL